MKKIFLKTLPAAAISFFTPLVSSADVVDRARCLAEDLTGSGGGITCLLVKFQEFLNMLLPVLASLALVGFFYGLVKYVFSAGDEDAKDQAKQVIIAGILALFLMAAIGGIIDFLLNATGTDGGAFGGNTFDPPTVDTGGSGNPFGDF